jgi:AraC family transcriptional regulator of adaptative response/methylated-DNA-[protein]-cysteine methyltransferase
MDTNGAPPTWARRLMERVEAAPQNRLAAADLRAMGIDPARARRYFLREHGMTFQAYQRARRLGMALLAIRQGKDVTNVALGHGYDSTSGFRDAFSKTFGRPPGKSREAECVVTTMIESPVGPLLAGATSKAVCLLEFTDRRMLEKQLQTVRRRYDCQVVPGRNEHVRQLEEELGEYFAGRLKKFTVPLDFRGSPFQMQVWRGLLKIPYGKTWSYEELAERVGHPGAHRAVGTANGCNRVAIVIPCHRVVNKDGKLGGYGGGLWRKQFLLDLERGQQRC